MVADVTMLVYLSHPLEGSDLPAAWRNDQRNIDRVRTLASGIEAARKGVETRHSHGIVAPHGATSAQRYRFRLISGDSDPEQYPHGPLGPRASAMPRMRRVDQLWIVGPRCRRVDAEAHFAEQLKVAVVVTSEQEQDAFVRAGIASAARSASSICESIQVRALSGERDDPDFRGAKAVVAAYYLSQTWMLGGGGIDYERFGRSGGGGAAAFRGHAEEMALRLASAKALFGSSRLSEVESRALGLRELHGMTFRQVSLRLGWPDDGAGEKRAERLIQRALRKITKVLRASEVADERVSGQ